MRVNSANTIAWHAPCDAGRSPVFSPPPGKKEPHVPDTIGYRKRIGIVVPSTNTTVQPETENLRVPGVTCHTGRVTIKERPLNTEEAFLEHMQMMRDGIGVAIDQIMTADLDHLILGIALETFWGGVAAAGKLQTELAQRAGVGVTMGSSAMVAALEKFGTRKVAILTPHQPRGDEMVRTYFREAGFDVVRLKGLKCATPRLIAQVPLADIRAALRELDGDDIEAVVTVGTALPAAEVAAEAERWLGKPVLAVNVVSFWHALRQCGIADKVYGHGRVLEEF
jgi:maleate isomerase